MDAFTRVIYEGDAEVTTYKAFRSIHKDIKIILNLGVKIIEKIFFISPDTIMTIDQYRSRHNSLVLFHQHLITMDERITRTRDLLAANMFGLTQDESLRLTNTMDKDYKRLRFIGKNLMYTLRTTERVLLRNSPDFVCLVRSVYEDEY